MTTGKVTMMLPTGKETVMAESRSAERASLLAAQVAAAQGRLAMDKRLGRPSDPRVVELAERARERTRRRPRSA